MSKIVILLFAALVLSTVDASDSTDRLRFIQYRLTSYLATVIDELKETRNTLIRNVMKNAEDFFDFLDEVHNDRYNDARLIWNMARQDTFKLRVKTLIIRGTEDCDEIVDSTYVEGRALLDTVNTNNEPKVYTLLLNGIDTMWTYHGLHDTLIDLTNRIGACARIFNMTTEIESVISCTEKIESQAKSFISVSIPSMAARISEAENSLITAINLAESFANGFADYVVHAANLTKKAEECYQHLLATTMKPTGAVLTKRLDAFDSMDELRSVQEQVELYLASEIDKLEKTYNTTILTIVENVEECFDSLSVFKDDTCNDIRLIWNKAKQDTFELSVKTLIIRGTEYCDDIVNSIYEKGRVLLATVYRHTVSKVHTASVNEADMMWSYDRLHDTLIDLKGGISVCAHTFNITTDVEDAILCNKKIKTKAETLISKFVPSMFAEINKTNDSIIAALNSVNSCENDCDDYVVHAVNMTKKAKECFQHLLETTLEPAEEAPTTPQATDEVPVN